MNKKEAYIVAVIGLLILIYWVSRSQTSQFALINSIASPYNTGNPAKTDKKLHNMNINKKLIPSLEIPFDKSDDRKELAKASNASKFPGDMDNVPVSQHETYTLEREAPIAAEQHMDLLDESFPLPTGDRTDIKVPGEKGIIY